MDAGDRAGAWIAQAGVGVAQLAAGRRSEARAAFVESLRMLGQEVGSGAGRATGVVCLRGLAAVAADGDPARAARLLAAADRFEPTVRPRAASAPPAVDPGFVDRLRAGLTPAAFDAAWATGAAMSLDDAISDAKTEEPAEPGRWLPGSVVTAPPGQAPS